MVLRDWSSDVCSSDLVVRLKSDTPSFVSSTDSRRLTVEIGIPNERAAWLMLSN